MTAGWLTGIAWVSIVLAVGSAAVIAYDIILGRHRQHMAIMNWVYPITGLYFGPLALYLYWRYARSGGGPRRRAAPRWLPMAIETSHCGAGCVLGDLISEWVIFAFAISVAGSTLGAEYLGDYALALVLGIVFQYFAIAPMRGLGLRDGLTAAAKADVISLTAFEIGLFGWMAVTAYWLFPAPDQLSTDSATFWLVMQVGMIVGFATSWPANVWLVRRGIKMLM